jgi:hypothetical protein
VDGDTLARDDPEFQARVADYLRHLHPCAHPDRRRRHSQYFEAIHCKAQIAMKIEDGRAGLPHPARLVDHCGLLYGCDTAGCTTTSIHRPTGKKRASPTNTQSARERGTQLR